MHITHTYNQVTVILGLPSIQGVNFTCSTWSSSCGFLSPWVWTILFYMNILHSPKWNFLQVFYWGCCTGLAPWTCFPLEGYPFGLNFWLSLTKIPLNLTCFIFFGLNLLQTSLNDVTQLQQLCISVILWWAILYSISHCRSNLNGLIFQFSSGAYKAWIEYVAMSSNFSPNSATNINPWRSC